MLEVGKEYKCLKDFEMDSGRIAYKKGKVYKCEAEDSLTDEQGTKAHSGMNYYQHEYFEEVFKNDVVNHPSHYTWLKDLCGIEVIDITRHMNFNLGNAIKYILRAGRKPIASEDKSDFYAGMIQDLKKAAWYINDEIERLQK